MPSPSILFFIELTPIHLEAQVRCPSCFRDLFFPPLSSVQNIAWNLKLLCYHWFIVCECRPSLIWNHHGKTVDEISWALSIYVWWANNEWNGWMDERLLPCHFILWLLIAFRWIGGTIHFSPHQWYSRSQRLIWSPGSESSQCQLKQSQSSHSWNSLWGHETTPQSLGSSPSWSGQLEKTIPVVIEQ